MGTILNDEWLNKIMDDFKDKCLAKYLNLFDKFTNQANGKLLAGIRNSYSHEKDSVTFG